MPWADSAGLVRTLVRTTHLEMTLPSQLRPSLKLPADLLLLRVGVPSPALSRFLYTSVGGDWYWLDRLTWTYADWMRWLERAEVETWVTLQRGSVAGYFELEAQQQDSVEITYFGLLREFAGQGLGSYLLTQACGRAWSMKPGVRRVWVHTCTLDHPGALHNYRARGFSVFKEEERSVELPDQPPGPWPGAGTR